MYKWGQTNLITIKKIDYDNYYIYTYMWIYNCTSIDQNIFSKRFITIYLIYIILTLNLNIKSFAYFAIASRINKDNIMSSMVIATMNQNSM